MRHTVPKNIWAKYEARIQRYGDGQARLLMEDTKITKSPKGDAILWDPTTGLLTNIKEHLIQERGFIRRACTKEHFDEQLEKINKLLAAQGVE